MRTEFRQTEPEREWRSLMAFDRRIFPPGDCFSGSWWRSLESYWLLVNGKKAGCCAFERHTGFGEADCTPEPGTLYIASTGIAQEWQGRGLGRLMKAWQLCFAQEHGFRRVVTNIRRKNRAMYHLNVEFGFRVVSTLPGYYLDPPDATIVMERKLRSRRKSQ